MGLIEPRLQASGKDSLDRIELNNAVKCATRLLLKSSNTTGGRPSGPGALCRFNLLMVNNTSSSENGVSVKVLISFPNWVALISLVGRGPSFRLLKCVKKWFMFVGIGSSVVCLAALILFQKLRGLLVLATSSLACNSAVALRFLFVWSEPCILSLPSISYSVLWYSQGVFAHIWLNA